jgi:hypothetical protein
MSQGKVDNAIFFEGGTPQASTSAALGVGGGGPFVPSRNLGKVYVGVDGKRWQRMKAAATLTQAAVASNIFYWSDISTMTVDTDLTDSQGGRNTVAGVFSDASDAVLPTAGQFFWGLQEALSQTLNGTNVNFTAAAKIIASATVGLVTCTVQGTAAVDVVIGTVHTAVDRSGGAGTVVCDIDIPSRVY